MSLQRMTLDQKDGRLKISIDKALKWTGKGGLGEERVSKLLKNEMKRRVLFSLKSSTS